MLADLPSAEMAISGRAVLSASARRSTGMLAHPPIGMNTAKARTGFKIDAFGSARRPTEWIGLKYSKYLSSNGSYRSSRPS
ncbi:hypothetical protein [Novosphingobium sp. ZW T3_23]|uniref:hypothetical protein n=1 Tax=Novosphingobium sp. ZW T3_23 TaxID=3378084 RepID=UPI0038546DC5